MPAWILHHIELILSILGLNVLVLIGWGLKRLYRRQRTLKLAASVIESHKNVLGRLTEMSDRLDKLFHSAVQFPDRNKFTLIHGVYWYIGSDGVHPKNAPLCPICLVKDKKPYILTPVLRQGHVCFECDFKTQNRFIGERVYQEKAEGSS